MESIVKNESECIVFDRKYRPEMKTAFELRKSPFSDNWADVKEWMDWTSDNSLMNERQFKSIKSCYSFSVYSYPNCTDSTRFETVTKLVFIIPVWDDHTEDSSGEIGRDVKRGCDIWGQFESALDCLIGKGSVPINKWKPYTYAIYSLFVTICDTFNEEQKRRFISVWKLYVMGNVEECHFFEGDVEMATVDDIIGIRRKTVAVFAFIQVLEYTDNICLTDGEWYDPQMQALTMLASDHVIYTNDLWSFEKEFAERGSRRDELLRISNSVAIYSGLKQCSIAEAMDAVIKRLGEVESEALTLMEAIRERPGVRNEVKLFVKSIECLISGNLKASEVMDRYNKFE